MGGEAKSYIQCGDNKFLTRLSRERVDQSITNVCRDQWQTPFHLSNVTAIRNFHIEDRRGMITENKTHERKKDFPLTRKRKTGKKWDVVKKTITVKLQLSPFSLSSL